MEKSTKELFDGEVMQSIVKDTLSAKEARKAFPSPTDTARKQAEKLSSMLRSGKGEFEGLDRLDEIEGVPGFEGCEGLEGLEAFENFEVLSSIQSVLSEHPMNVLTLVRLIGLERAREPSEIEKDMEQYFSEKGKAGAKKRWASKRELEQWTIVQYKAGSWNSANKAAHDLKDKVLAHGEEVGYRLSEENAQRTIADWINSYRKSV